MRKIIIFTLLWCTASLVTTAQPEGNIPKRNQKIKAEKIKFINKGLDLSKNEAAEFWTLMDKMDGEKRKVIKKYKPQKSFEWMSEEEAEKAILDYFQKEESLIQLKKDYYWKMKAVIGSRKTAAYYKLERQFKKKLLQRKRKQRRQN